MLVSLTAIGTLCFKHVASSQTSSSPIQWKDVEKRLKHQVTLRAVSCVQLASKLSSHYHLVSLSKAKSFLASCGFRYAATSIVQSEIRVLKTLDYTVHQPTPLDFIEVLLGSLVHNDKSIPAKHLHALSLKILDIFYLQRSQILSKLKSLSPGELSRRSCSDNDVNMLATDKMLMATAIISTAGFILGQPQTKHISNQLAEMICMEKEDIITIASVLLEEVFARD